jgi:hypothetical protein
VFQFWFLLFNVFHFLFLFFNVLHFYFLYFMCSTSNFCHQINTHFWFLKYEYENLKVLWPFGPIRQCDSTYLSVHYLFQFLRCSPCLNVFHFLFLFFNVLHFYFLYFMCSTSNFCISCFPFFIFFYLMCSAFNNYIQCVPLFKVEHIR